MKLKDRKKGEIFNIEKTPSYPKLKTEKGYVDLRDGIVNESGNCDDKETYEMTVREIAKLFIENEKDINEWIETAKLKFL